VMRTAWVYWFEAFCYGVLMCSVHYTIYIYGPVRCVLLSITVFIVIVVVVQ